MVPTEGTTKPQSNRLALQHYLSEDRKQKSVERVVSHRSDDQQPLAGELNDMTPSTYLAAG